MFESFCLVGLPSLQYLKKDSDLEATKGSDPLEMGNEVILCLLEKVGLQEGSLPHDQVPSLS